MNDFQIKDFIAIHNVHQTFAKSFSSLLDQNTAEDLNINDKNVSIDVETWNLSCLVMMLLLSKVTSIKMEIK
jgi:hypothetical protein